MGASLKALLALAWLAAGLPAGASATADGPDYFRVRGVAANDTLNIRSAPSASADKIGEIPPDGDGIRNLGCEGGMSLLEWEAATEEQRARAAEGRWCRIIYRDVEGWAAGRFLGEGSEPVGPK